jgi:hypothetical protein
VCSHLGECKAKKHNQKIRVEKDLLPASDKKRTEVIFKAMPTLYPLSPTEEGKHRNFILGTDSYSHRKTIRGGHVCNSDEFKVIEHRFKMEDGRHELSGHAHFSIIKSQVYSTCLKE